MLNHLFRRLFRHRACQRPQGPTALSPIIRTTFTASHPGQGQGQWRSFLSRRKQLGNDGKENKNTWYRRGDYPRDLTEELEAYPLVTAKELRSHRERPRRVKMMTREFIEGIALTVEHRSQLTCDVDSLYNPHYGYFSKHAIIFSPGEPFDFNHIDDGPAFYQLLGERYTEFEDRLDRTRPDNARQLWHTPTELFRPYYGETIARYLVSNYKLTLYPYHDLNIYEMGAGNGTMMLNILDFIRDTDYEVYQRTKFKVIEISPNLARLQMQNLQNNAHQDHVEIVNRSIFDWDSYVHSPCFFLALEVIDNFAHDTVRYDCRTELPLQGAVMIDAHGEFHDYDTPMLDPLVSRFLRVRQAAAQRPFPMPLLKNPPRFVRNVRNALPFAPALTQPEYLPTRLLQFFEILNSYFPAHRLVVSDFNALPDTVPGFNAPVVQTRYKRRPVPVSTPFVCSSSFLFQV